MYDLWFQHLSSTLASSGHAAYIWDVGADRYSWAGDVQGIFGLPSEACPAANRQFQAFLNPQNMAQRAAALHDFLNGSPEQRDGSKFSAAYKICRADGQQIDVEEVSTSSRNFTTGQKIIYGILKIRQEKPERQAADSSAIFSGRAAIRRLIEQWADHAGDQHKGMCYLLVVGMDRMSLMNEAFGARYVDEIIEKTEERLRRIAGRSAHVCRIDGDVFAIFFESGLKSEMLPMAHHMLSNFYEVPLDTSKGPIVVSISIGGSDVTRDKCTNGNSPLVCAERAMHAAKDKGRNCFVSYEEAASQAADNRFLLEAGDRFVKALKDDRVRLAFQPVMDPHTNKVSFHECLARMMDEKGNLIPAADFFPAVEKLGLSRLVDQYALQTAIQELGLFSELVLSVNVSNLTLNNHDWLRGIVFLLRDQPSVARRLIIEITETAVMSDLKKTSRVIKTLQDLGCRVALDDFGSGYTAFSQLKDLDVDIVKIDKVFVRDMKDSHNHLFIRTLQTLADGFGLETVGEGVETAADAARLAGDGVDHVQGYAFGFPRIERLWLPEAHIHRNISFGGVEFEESSRKKKDQKADAKSAGAV